MLLKCNKCKHTWNDTPSCSQVMVQCPECFAVVPMVLAKDEKRATAATASIESTPAATVTMIEPVQPTTTHVDETVAPGRYGGKPPVRRVKIPDPVTDTPTSDAFGQTAIVPSSPTIDGKPSFARDTIEAPDASTIVEPDNEVTRGRVEDSSRKPFAASSAKEIDLTGRTVGGYYVKSMLGAGGMGAVCLARQMSLDRDVALKILPGKYATNPEFLLRFTREALSAAQLSHHNIVQVYDVGSQDDLHYISMEYVRGENLGECVKGEGRLTPDDAAAYVLQAARGLKYAHDMGVVHRDIKPDNLMLNEHGIVKIADMGLAKVKNDPDVTMAERPAANRSVIDRARGDITITDVAMGTPAFMAPEQARDASSVDHRADQYSLGCTFYYLVTGKAPYGGSTIHEIISKHQSEPVPTLSGEVRGVPDSLNKIIQRMLAKDPSDRYPEMSDLISDLEGYLGVEGEKGAAAPREQHLQILEEAHKEYYEAPLLKVRKAVGAAFPAALGVSVLGAFIIGEPLIAATLIGVGLFSILFGFLVGGVLRKTYLFSRVRSVFFHMPLLGWVKTALVVIGIVGALWALKLLVPWVIAAIVAAGLAVGYQLRVVRALDRQRQPALQRVQDMLKQLRVRGVSEEVLQSFVCRFTGSDWEEFFEDLFGYEAMVLARGKWAATDRVRTRKKYATWRDLLLRWLESVEDERRVRREKRQLAKIEAQRLKAQGMAEKEAQKQAVETAEKMHTDIHVAAELARQSGQGEKPKKKKKVRDAQPSLAVEAFRAVRFAAGAAVIVAFAAFMLQGTPLPGAGAIHSWVSSQAWLSPYADELHSWLGLGVGIALVASSRTRRLLGPLFVLAGMILFIMLHPILAHVTHPLASPQNAFYLAAGLMIIGAGVSLSSQK